MPKCANPRPTCATPGAAGRTFNEALQRRGECWCFWCLCRTLPWRTLGWFSRTVLTLDGSANAMCMGGCVLMDVAASWILASQHRRCRTERCQNARIPGRHVQLQAQQVEHSTKHCSAGVSVGAFGVSAGHYHGGHWAGFPAPC